MCDHFIFLFYALSEADIVTKSSSAATNLFLVHDKRCLVSHWPPTSEIGMRLITSWNSA